MGILKTTKIFDIWLLHVVHMQEINNKIEAMTTIHMNHSLCTEDNKYDLQTCQTSILKHQVIDSMIDLDTLHYLSERQGIDPLSKGPPPINVETPQYANETNDQMNHIYSILSIEDLKDDQKQT